MKKNAASQSSRNHTFRSMRMEPLEGRLLLAVGDWQGFEDFPDRYTYESGGAIVEFDKPVDLLSAADLNSDGFDDLVTVNKADSSVLVYLSDGAGGYGTAQITVIDKNLASNDIGVALGDFNADGIFDLLVADTSNHTDIAFSLFSWSNGSFTLTKASDPISLSVFSPTASKFYANSIEVVQVGDSGAAVRMQAMVPGAASCDRIVLFSCDASGSFSAATGTPYGTVNGESLVGSLTENGHSFLVTLGKKTGQTFFNAYDVTSAFVPGTTFSYKVDPWKYTSGETAMTEPLGAVASGQNLHYCDTKKMVTVTLSLDESAQTGSFGNASSVAYSCFASSTRAIPMAVGSFASTASTDVMAVSGVDYVLFKSNGEGGFTPISVVTQPDYFASWQGDYNGDDTLDLLVVGASGIWLFEDSDLTVQPIQLGNLNGTATAAVIGYFGSGQTGVNDALIDVAVLYDGKVGIFYQGADGRFTEEGVVSEGSRVAVFESVPSTAYTTLIASGDVLGKSDTNQADQIVVAYYHTSQAGEESGLYVTVIDPLLASDEMVLPGRCVEGNFSSTDELTALRVETLCSGDDKYADVLYTVCRTRTPSTIVVLDNTTGSLDDAEKKTISAVPEDGAAFLYNPYQPVSVACGDIDGDGKKDIVFLSAGTGQLDAAVGYVLQTDAGVFSAVKYVLDPSSSESGEAGGNHHRPDEGFPGDEIDPINGGISQIGEVGGLIVADINGDGKLDAVFTLNNEGRSKFYTALGTGTAAAPLDLPVYQALAGGDAAGVNFFGTSAESQAAPYLLVSLADGNPAPSLYAVKGKVVLRLDPSYEKAAEGTMTVVIRGLDGKVATEAMTVDQIQNQTSVYDWLDEWSTFYIEIWGAPTASSKLSQFSVELSFCPGYYVFSAVQGGSGFAVSVDGGTSGKLVVSGYADSAVMVDSGEQALLARVKMAPVTGGGIFLDDLEQEGVFQLFTNAETFNLSISPDAQSINKSHGIDNVTETLDQTTYFPVRFDFDDNGSVDDDDLINFLLYYGDVPVGKYNIFRTTDDLSINDDHLIDFLMGYGWSYDGIQGSSYVTGGFYRDALMDPYERRWVVRPNDSFVDTDVTTTVTAGRFVEMRRHHNFDVPNTATANSTVIVDALDSLYEESAAALTVLPLISDTSDRDDWLFDFVEESQTAERLIESELLDRDLPPME